MSVNFKTDIKFLNKTSKTKLNIQISLFFYFENIFFELMQNCVDLYFNTFLFK